MLSTPQFQTKGELDVMYMYEKSIKHYIVCLEGGGPSTESSDED